jgi:sulfoxide reductase heme-binding subunit YedZ
MYVGLHLLIFAGWDYGFDLRLLGPAIFTQRFVIVGLVTFLILLALAVTSTPAWQKRLGKNWKRLHQLFYLAAVLDIVHFLLLVKDTRRPLRYGVVVALLLIARIPPIRKALAALRRFLGRALA